jgi:hypothetical protein
LHSPLPSAFPTQELIVASIFASYASILAIYLASNFS